MSEWTHTYTHTHTHTHTQTLRKKQTLSRSANAFNHQHHRRQISVPPFLATTTGEVRGLVVNTLKDYSVIKDSKNMTHDGFTEKIAETGSKSR